jgi:hypothetical protein
MVVCCMRRAAGWKRRFVYLQVLPCREFAFQNVTDLRVVGRSNRQLVERIHSRRQGTPLFRLLFCPHDSQQDRHRKHKAQFSSRHGH